MECADPVAISGRARLRAVGLLAALIVTFAGALTALVMGAVALAALLL
ncbi:MAG: hypothetical protein ACKVWR_18625 [Acidimicrobiales bacterium]